MKRRHAPSATRVVLGTLTAVVLLTAATAAAASPAPITSEQFAPDWQAHAHGLINMGPAAKLAKTRWYVPANLPRGQYVLVERKGDKAEVIDGYRFEITGDAARDIYLFLTPGYGDVAAIPLADVPALKAPPGARGAR